jgi:amino acid permease
MTTVGALISWAGICFTYLRFRQCYLIRNIHVEEAGKSPLQPALAIYGLSITIFLSNIYHGERSN